MARPSEYKRMTKSKRKVDRNRISQLPDQVLKKSERKVDRISHLPDEVLGHILSYVSTKQSVQTSVLSKRWLLVWTDHVPCINIDDSTLLAIPMVGTYQKVHTRFIDFFDNLLNPCNEASIRKFSLKCHECIFDLFHINKWIEAATKRRVQELDICIISETRFGLSNSLFAYQELVELRLGKNLILSDVSGTLSFPSLKKLHFHYITFDDDSINKFLSSCPVLENLHLEKCMVENLDTLDINAPALKFLTVYDTSFRNYTYKFILESPNLEVLKYSCPLATKGYCFKNLDSLVKADIHVEQDRIYSKYNIPHALNMVTGIANAKILRLTGCTSEFFSLLDVLDLPIFHNLTKLQLEGSKHCGLLLSQLLRNSPNLEVLVINKGEVGGSGSLNYFEWENPSSVPECLYLHLKVVKIWGFEEQKDVGRFIRFVLLHARNLNKFLTTDSKSKFKKLKISEQELTYLLRSKTKHANVLLGTTQDKSEPKELTISEHLLTYLKKHKAKK